MSAFMTNHPNWRCRSCRRGLTSFYEVYKYDMVCRSCRVGFNALDPADLAMALASIQVSAHRLTQETR